MKTYELVCVIEPTLAANDTKALKERVEGILTSHSCEIKDIDDMWLLPLAYPLNGQDQAVIVSYYISADTSVLDEMKTQLRLEKWLAKYFFYSMSENEEFMKYSDLKKTYEDMLPKEEETEEETEE